MKKAWLNFILHLTSYIYKNKTEIVSAKLPRSVYLAFSIIILEVLLFVISLPTYFLFPSAKLEGAEKYQEEMQKYRLQRKVTLVVVFTVAGIITLNAILLFLITFFG